MELLFDAGSRWKLFNSIHNMTEIFDNASPVFIFYSYEPDFISGIDIEKEWMVMYTGKNGRIRLDVELRGNGEFRIGNWGGRHI